MAKQRPSLYMLSIILFMVLLPVGSVTLESTAGGSSTNISIIGKWFLFWAVGMRLLIAGLRQISNPAFTAQEIFHINDTTSFTVIRELGFANVCMGLIAVISLYQTGWRTPAAVAGGLYFGLAGFMHVLKKADSQNEVIAMISDLYIFAIMLTYVTMTLSDPHL